MCQNKKCQLNHPIRVSFFLMYMYLPKYISSARFIVPSPWGEFLFYFIKNRTAEAFLTLLAPHFKETFNRLAHLGLQTLIEISPTCFMSSTASSTEFWTILYNKRRFSYRFVEKDISKKTNKKNQYYSIFMTIQSLNFVIRRVEFSTSPYKKIFQEEIRSIDMSPGSHIYR